MQSYSKQRNMQRDARLLFAFMVIFGFVVNFILIAGQDGRRLTPGELYAGIACGLIYLLLGLNIQWFFDHLPKGWAAGLFFTIECALVFSIGLVIGTGGTWLVGIPLAAFAVESLEPRWRGGLYLGLVAALVLPIGLRHGTWLGALINTASNGAAVFFVALFAQLRLNEQQAREQMEQLMSELAQANNQLASYATQAEELAMTQERNRLAREIHDNLAHTLTIVNVQIEAAKVVMEARPGQAMDALNKAQEMTQQGLVRVRESVAALRESPVSNRSIGEALKELLAETQRAGIVTDFTLTGESFALRNKVKLALYRAAQEGLTNVRRHARASRVDVLLAFEPGKISLTVHDNGVGCAEVTTGFGLLGIRERMQLLGGSLEVHTALGEGFRLTVHVPVPHTNGAGKPTE